METTYYATTRLKELDVPKRKELAVGKGVLRSNKQCSFAPEGQRGLQSALAGSAGARPLLRISGQKTLAPAQDFSSVVEETLEKNLFNFRAAEMDQKGTKAGNLCQTHHRI